MMRFIKKRASCGKCFWVKSTTCVEPDDIECFSDQHALDRFNAQSYREKSPKPLKAKMSYFQKGESSAKDVEIAPYISLGKKDPAILYEGNTAATYISSLWRDESLCFTLDDGRVLAAHEVEGELYGRETETKGKG